MPQQTSWQIAEIGGLKDSNRRAVVFLIGDACDGKAKFDRLAAQRERDLRNRMDHWIDGQIKDEYHHGWPNSQEHKSCYCFKWREKKVRQRLYGHLCNPREGDARFRLCVLMFYDDKTTEDTDLTILGAINKIAAEPAVKEVIRVWAKKGS